MNKLDKNKVKSFAQETNAEVRSQSLYWPGPPSSPENGLSIPFSDLGRTVDGVMYRVSLAPNKTNTLIK